MHNGEYKFVFDLDSSISLNLYYAYVTSFYNNIGSDYNGNYFPNGTYYLWSNTKYFISFSDITDSKTLLAKFEPTPMTPHDNIRYNFSQGSINYWVLDIKESGKYSFKTTSWEMLLQK